MDPVAVDCASLSSPSSVPIDTALIQFNPPPSSWPFYSISSSYGDCYNCPSTSVFSGLSPLDAPLCFQLPTSYSTKFTVSSGPLCTASITPVTLSPDQHGVYSISPLVSSVGECSIAAATTISPDTFASFTSPLLFLLLSFVAPLVLRCLYNSCCCKTSSDDSDPFSEPLSSPLLSSPSPNHLSPQATAKRRVNSLDVFRGLSLILMIFVNYGGGGYFFFNHSTWNGLTVADLLFPWFIWIMGVTVGATFKPPSSIASRTSKLFAALKRSVKLFCLGLLLNSLGTNGDLSKLRIPGVLQYFSISYLYINLLALLVDSPSASKARLALGYTVGGTALLVMYCGLTYAVPVPGCPTGYLGAGGLYDEEKHPLCTGGSHRYIDEQILSSAHFYDNPTCKSTYNCLSYDPEGIVGGFNAAFLSFLGFVTGKLVRAIPRSTNSPADHFAFLKYNAFGGLVLLTTGAVLCNFSENDGVIPVNKNLWSPSFIFVVGGGANLLFGLFYVLLDMQRSTVFSSESFSFSSNKFTDPSFLEEGISSSLPLWDGWPLREVGKNSITLYMGHEILDSCVPFVIYFSESSMDEHWGKILSNVIGVTCWCVVALYMDSKKLYITV
mmetsp:Transcript_14361/g.29557  ORF Transcript_14361/g.29557 Transcript_14361/m.29557 type:complete len:610 (-) Transcript_14361:18-1847(-)